MYAVMFRTQVDGVFHLFAIAVEEGTDGMTVLADESELAVASRVRETYDEVLLNTPDDRGWLYVARHADAFRPVTVRFDDEQSFLDRVIGENEDGTVELCIVGTEAGEMTGIECLGPDAAAAYASGRPVPAPFRLLN